MLDPYIRATLQHDSQVGNIFYPVLATSVLCSSAVPQLMCCCNTTSHPDFDTISHRRLGTAGQLLYEI